MSTLSIKLSDTHEIHLDEKCWCCNGGTKKPEPGFIKDGKCEICEGVGYKKTYEGDIFSQFIYRYHS